MKKIISIFIGICILLTFFHHHENEGIVDENTKSSISLKTGELFLFVTNDNKFDASEQCSICNFSNTTHLFYFNSNIVLYSNIYTTIYVISTKVFTDNLLINISIPRAPPVFS